MTTIPLPSHIVIDLDPATDKEPGDWALAIGGFLASFTACEYWTFQYIKTFGSARLRKVIAKEGVQLKTRTEIARALVLDLNLTDSVHTEVDSLFDQINTLAISRNLVAHNPPMRHVYEGPGGSLRMKHELRSQRNLAKGISLEKLRELAANAKELDRALLNLFTKLQQPSSRKDGDVCSPAQIHGDVDGTVGFT